jgi:hypothetical protein
MPGIRELAVQFREALVRSNPGVSTGQVCAEIAEELARTEKACAAVRVRYAARASECGEHRKRGYGDPSDWMARSTGSSRGQARAALGTLKALDACPATKGALAAGDVSLEHSSVRQCHPSPSGRYAWLRVEPSAVHDLQELLRERLRLRGLELGVGDHVLRFQVCEPLQLVGGARRAAGALLDVCARGGVPRSGVGLRVLGQLSSRRDQVHQYTRVGKDDDADDPRRLRRAAPPLW